MKIRLALNSDYVSRKIRGAAYGILLLLTFFVPQFAKTQDQLNAVKTAQAAVKPVIALEQKQAGISVDASRKAYKAVSPMADAASAAPWTSRPETEGTPVAAEPVPVEIASLITPTDISAKDASALETVRFTEPPIGVKKEIEVIKPTAGFDVKQPVQVASLLTTVMPAAQSAPVSSVSYSGEYVNADFVNMPLNDFFRLMSDIGGINIILDPAISGNVNLKVVKMPWDELFEAVLRNNGLDKRIDGSHVRIALKKTLQEEAKQEEDLKKASILAADLDTQVKRLNYAKAKELKDILGDRTSERGSVLVDERTNSIVLIDLKDSIKELVKLIDGLDIPQPQVEIETRIVSATRNFARDIGVQFGFVQGNGKRVTVGGSNTNYLQPNANRPMGETSSGSDSPGVSTGGSDTGGNLNVNLPARSPFGGIGIAVGNIVDTFMLDTAITAGESKGWAKMISVPKVIVQNNSPAVINDGVRFPVQVVSDNTITIQFYDAALTLTVTPQITYDSNIMLELQATNNKADFGYVSTSGVPSIRTSETSTRILVSDGGTTMISSVNVDDEGSNEEKVPGLGSLPLLGHLFRRTGNSRDSQEIMFFVTPRILK